MTEDDPIDPADQEPGSRAQAANVDIVEPVSEGEPASEPAGDPVGAPQPRAAGPGAQSSGAQSRFSRRAGTPFTYRRLPRGGIISVVLAIVCLVAVAHLLSGQAATQQAAPVPTVLPFVATSIGPLSVAAVLGGSARLRQPREAVQLANGHFAVADTGNNRVALLDARGRFLGSVDAGGAHRPFAVVESGRRFYVLDAGAKRIDSFDSNGRFLGTVFSSSADLQDARGMALSHGNLLYVADPLTNTILEIGTDHTLRRQLGGPVGDGPGQFNQPSDVAVDGKGAVYVVDNNNFRIQQLTPSGKFVREWTAPPSDTLHSIHLLPLRHGRFLATDQAKGVALYGPGTGTPSLMTLPPITRSSPYGQIIGISRLRHGTDFLLTDASGNRLVLVHLPVNTPGGIKAGY